MKRNILFTGAICLLSGVAIAKTIDFDTPVRWNTLVIKTSLNDVGLFGEYGYHYDVQATYHRILEDLLEKDTFSCRTATDVCMKQCNKSDLLRNGRGESGRKCSDICKEFANALISNNNKNITSRRFRNGEGDYDCDGRIYSEDKKFYALTNNKFGFGVYESASNQKIGTIDGLDGEDGAYDGSIDISGGKYNGWRFAVYEGISLTSEYDEARCGLSYETLERRYSSNVVWHLNDYISLLERTQKNVQELMYKNVDNSDGLIQSDVIKSREWFQNVNREIDSAMREINAIKNAPVNSVSYANGLKFVENRWSSDSPLKQIDTKFRALDSEMSKMDSAINNADCVRKLFKNGTNKFKYKRTDTKEEAYDMIKETCGLGGLAKMTCSGECKKLGDDKVTCHIGSLSETFVFDSICRTLKDKLNDLNF